MVAALLLVLALAEAARGLDPVRVHPPTQEFVDTLGRVRYFRGLNAVSKMPPFVPVQDRFDPRNSISEEDAKNLEKWGFNVIRLGVMWSAVEPELGFFNTTYLASMREVVQRLARHGVYTIIDAHQDAMSRRFCGEGFPDFAVKPSRATQGPLLKFPRPFFYDLPTDPATGFPALDKCQEHQFFQYYLTFECSSAWINFYEDQALHREFARSWEHVAAAFNDTEGVLGYEVGAAAALRRPAPPRCLSLPTRPGLSRPAAPRSSPPAAVARPSPASERALARRFLDKSGRRTLGGPHRSRVSRPALPHPARAHPAG